QCWPERPGDRRRLFFRKRQSSEACRQAGNSVCICASGAPCPERDQQRPDKEAPLYPFVPAPRAEKIDWSSLFVKIGRDVGPEVRSSTDGSYNLWLFYGRPPAACGSSLFTRTIGLE